MFRSLSACMYNFGACATVMYSAVCAAPTHRTTFRARPSSVNSSRQISSRSAASLPVAWAAGGAHGGWRMGWQQRRMHARGHASCMRTLARAARCAPPRCWPRPPRLTEPGQRGAPPLKGAAGAGGLAAGCQQDDWGLGGTARHAARHGCALLPGPLRRRCRVAPRPGAVRLRRWGFSSSPFCLRGALQPQVRAE